MKKIEIKIKVTNVNGNLYGAYTIYRGEYSHKVYEICNSADKLKETIILLAKSLSVLNKQCEFTVLLYDKKTYDYFVQSNLNNIVNDNTDYLSSQVINKCNLHIENSHICFKFSDKNDDELNYLCNKAFERSAILSRRIYEELDDLGFSDMCDYRDSGYYSKTEWVSSIDVINSNKNNFIHID